MGRLLIGTEKFDEGKEVVWDSEMTINPHVLVIGTSGAGKTHRFRSFIEQLCIGDTRIHIFDVHGDLLSVPSRTSTVTFSESSPFGINPLKISADMEYGGVRRKVQSFISMVSRYSVQLGVNQQAVMRSLLYDLYSANGIYQDQPRTWATASGKMPNFLDLKRFAYSKLKSMLIGGNNETFKQLDTLNRKLMQLDKKMRGSSQDGGEGAEEVDKLKRDCRAAFSAYIENLKTGRELDEYIKYSSKDNLKSIYHRIEVLYSLGIFKEGALPFKNTSIWHYDIKSLSREEQGYIVEIILEEIFMDAKRRGVSDRLRHICILDEAHQFVSAEGGHIINVICKEARKFGVGMFFSTPNLSDLPEDIVSACATKLILGIDEIYHENLSRRLNIELKKLRYIKPRKTAIAQVKNKDFANNNRFIDVVLAA